jgi:hypothetical protein
MSRIPFVFKLDNAGQPTGVTILLDGRPFPVLRSAKFFDEIFKALNAQNEAEVRKYLKLKNSIAEFSDGKFQLFEESLYYNGAEVHNEVVRRILECYKLGGDVLPMVNFLENVLQNPSDSSRDELYLFLEHCDLPITEDGFFLAYKMIRDDYKDIYTGTMDNSVGATPTVDRNTVDTNRHNTCSRGLHFASLHYIENGSYGSKSSGHRLVIVKINPKDVVSIPTDYNNSKGRAWTYTVIQEIEWENRLKPYVADESKPVVDPTEWDEQEEESEEELCDGCGLPLDDCECEQEEEGEEEEEESSTTGTLTADDVRSIRKLLKAANMSLTQIGAMYGVHRTTIQRIRDGISHTNIQ